MALQQNTTAFTSVQEAGEATVAGLASEGGFPPPPWRRWDDRAYTHVPIYMHAQVHARKVMIGLELNSFIHPKPTPTITNPLLK